MTASVPIRLHITPLDAGLLPTVLGPQLTKAAENISFQLVETFPENNYGFLDLPEAESKTLISRLNGAILKGRKMKVERARTKKRSHDALRPESTSDLDKDEKKVKKSRKEKKSEHAVIEGYQLPTDRRVKRGWTEPKSDERTRSKSKTKSMSKDDTKKSKRQAPSQYTEKEELLFRTEVPPNKRHLDQSTGSKTKDKGKDKNTRNRNTETLVHEFQHTEIQPAFIRETTSSVQAAEYIDNVGWVDSKGGVIEKAPAPSSQKNPILAEDRRIALDKPDGAKSFNEQKRPAETAFADATSDSASDDEDDEDDEDDDTELRAETTSDSGSSVSTSEPSDEDQPAVTQVALSNPQGNDPASLETPQKMHPLEALFKRPNPPAGQEAAKPSLEIETSFSFFDQSAADGDDDLPAMPATPFTSIDMRSRGVRSAAPTPDTAHPSRFTGFAGLMATRSSSEQSKEVALPSTVGNDQSVPASEQSDTHTESDFERRFWAERGQNNRAWKTRRKTALKEQRQKENRLRRPRNW